MELTKNNNELFSLLQKISENFEQAEIHNDSFSYGRCSAALYSLYYGHHFGNEKHLQRGVEFIEEVLENIINGKTSFSGGELYSGLTGFTSTINNLKKADLLDIDMEQFNSIEKFLFHWSMEQISLENTDFFSGVSGSLNYFINRLDTIEDKNETFDRIFGYINEIITALEQLFVIAQNNGTFLVNKYYINANKENPGAVNFGIAHGTSSLIINFLLLKKKGLLNQDLQIKCDDLIQSIFYLRKIYKPEYPYYFVNQYNIHDHSVDFQNRIGWCYSDLNIIHLLALDQQISGHENYNNAINECSKSVLSRKDFNKNRLDDPFFCHGYSGVAEYYRVLYKLTDNEDFLSGYAWALQQILDYYSTKEKNSNKKNLHSFFYGDLGVGFVLMNALKPECSTWNEIVLL